MNLRDCKNTIKAIETYLEKLNLLNNESFTLQVPEIIDILNETVLSLTVEVYGIKTISAVQIISGLNRDNLTREMLNRLVTPWLDEIREDINTLSKYPVSLDKDFEQMMLALEKSSEEELLNRIMSVLQGLYDSEPQNYLQLIRIYTKYTHFWGGFNPAADRYDHFINGIRATKHNTDKIRWLYNLLEDYRSKKALYGIIRFWLELDFDYKNSIRENNYDDYFDLDVFNGKISEDEVIVDCGAYIGDTAKAYFNNFSSCKKMYLYDMIRTNLEHAKLLLEDHDEILYVNAGVGSADQSGTEVLVKDMVTASFSVGDQNEGINPDEEETVSNEVYVKIVSLDEDIKEPITFLKMDIEGSEKNALAGAKDHIINDHPKLAICTYHHYEDLWEIPEMIYSYDPNYKFYLRYNGDNDGIMASEHVILAV